MNLKNPDWRDTDKIHHGADAELVAMQQGIYHDLLARVADEKPQKKGNVLTRTAIAEGFFIHLLKKFDGSLEWFAITGPTAHLRGLEFGAGCWNTHQGDKKNRKAEVRDLPSSSQN